MAAMVCAPCQPAHGMGYARVLSESDDDDQDGSASASGDSDEEYEQDRAADSGGDDPEQAQLRRSGVSGNISRPEGREAGLLALLGVRADKGRRPVLAREVLLEL
eukprot:COSAG06_NODE_12711_length_1339_cov_33.105645_1_plen_104_part_10